MSDSKQEKMVNFYTNMIYFIVMIALVVMRICNHYKLFSFLGNNASFIIGLFCQIGLIFLLPILLLKFLTKSKVSDVAKFCCFKKVSYKIVIASIILGIVVFILNVFVSNFFNSIIQMFGYKHPPRGQMNLSWWWLILELFGTAVLPAFCEETLNRGMLLNGNSMSGMKKSILISGFLFGLLHLNIEQVFYASIIGLLLGYLCWGCSSIWPCIIIHFMNNALSVFSNFAVGKGWVASKFLDGIVSFVTDNKIIGIVMLVLFIFLLLFVAFELIRYLFRETFKYNFAGRQQELATMAMREAYLQSVEDIKNEKEVGKAQPIDVEHKIIDEKEFMRFVNENLETIIKNSVAELEEQEKFKPDIKSKIFMWGSVALGVIITAMTFIWGLLL